MKGPYIITNSKCQVCSTGYDFWDTNEEARQQIISECEMIENIINELKSSNG